MILGGNEHVMAKIPKAEGLAKANIRNERTNQARTPIL